MRAPLALVPLVLLLAPAATAEEHPLQPMVLRVQPFLAPVTPLRDAAVTNLTVEVPCAALAPGNATRVTLAVDGAPGFAQATLSPSAVTVEPCEGDVARATGSLILRFTAEAPAFAPVVLNVTAEAPGFERALAAVQAAPGFLGVLEASVPQRDREARSGDRVVFPITITNSGNGAQRVTFRVESELVVEPPAAVVVPARADGVNGTVTVDLAAVTPPTARTIVLHLAGASAQNPSVLGDSIRVFLSIVPKGPAVPAPPAAAALAALAAVAALAARRR